MAVLDLYCERLGPGLLAEPLNAVTNGAFLVAAWRLASLASAIAACWPWRPWPWPSV